MIGLERHGDVFLLRMSGGENRIDAAFLAAFHAALDDVEAAAGPAALVSTGQERFYSNGLDLAGLAGGGREGAAGVLAELHRLFARLLAFPAVSVAAVNGHAFAGGAMLALAHDFRVMRADRGYLCLPEIELATGQPLTPGMYALIGARVPAPIFHEMLVTGRRYGGIEAAELGIVHEAADADQVVPRALARAAALADRDRPTQAALKRGLYREALAVLAAESGAT